MASADSAFRSDLKTIIAYLKGDPGSSWQAALQSLLRLIGAAVSALAANEDQTLEVPVGVQRSMAVNPATPLDSPNDALPVLESALASSYNIPWEVILPVLEFLLGKLLGRRG